MGTMPIHPGGFQDVFRGDVMCLWERVQERLKAPGVTDVIVLDDGGRCASLIPRDLLRKVRVSGVEQTTSGLTVNGTRPAFRIVEVATSAAKRILESPMISRAVLRRLPNLEATRHCGVIGVGSVGSAIVSRLLEQEHSVSVFDRDPRRVSVSSVTQNTRSV